MESTDEDNFVLWLDHIVSFSLEFPVDIVNKNQDSRPSLWFFVSLVKKLEKVNVHSHSFALNKQFFSFFEHISSHPINQKRDIGWSAFLLLAVCCGGCL
jgi:hypothetical protein